MALGAKPLKWFPVTSRPLIPDLKVGENERACSIVDFTSRKRNSRQTVKEGRIGVPLRKDCHLTPSLDWQSISNEVRNSSRRGRIQVRQNCDDVTWPRADLQLAIHPGRATAMSEASRSSVVRNGCAFPHTCHFDPGCALSNVLIDDVEIDPLRGHILFLFGE